MATPHQPATTVPGFPALAALFVGGVVTLATFAAMTAVPALILVAFPLAVAVVLGLIGLYTVQPNEAKVLVFFGTYAGTVTDTGFFWSNPFASRRTVSMKVSNFHTDTLKVNDAQGNPIEIGAVIQWSVDDPAKAVFDVERYDTFVSTQAETAIRTLASHFPYDAHEEGPSLRGSPDAVAHRLQDELQHRLAIAGVKVHDARLSHLAYAPEIAQAMLRRQQAQAIITARTQIVEGAVTMVEMALQRLEQRDIVRLDPDRKAAMVSNLLVVLVGEGEAQPVIQTGASR